MYLRKKLNILRLVTVNSGVLGIMVVYAVGVFIAYENPYVSLPSLPSYVLTPFSFALALLISNIINKAYDRYWEGRKIWGGLINVSRNFSRNVLCSNIDDELKKTMVRRQIAYVYAVKNNLCGDTNYDKVFSLLNKTSEEMKMMNGSTNIALFLNIKQGESVHLSARKGVIDGHTEDRLSRTLSEIIDCQGKAERIKNTPLFRPYAFFTKVFFWIFIFLVPLVYVKGMSFYMIPITVIIGFAFTMLIDIGTSSEEPFVVSNSSLPMNDLCNTIERDLCEMNGDLVPKKEGAINGILK
tara:strand:- start:41 stop:931 length:891 start_codon:yes stop_codon:yes gene_type:complete